MTLKEFGKFALVAFGYLGFCLGLIAVAALVYDLIPLLEKLAGYVRNLMEDLELSLITFVRKLIEGDDDN